MSIHLIPDTNLSIPGSPIDPAIVRRASEWMARLWSGEATDENRDACARWRAEHPDHERAWQRLQVVEDKLYAVPREVARRALREPAVKAYITRRRVLRLLGLTVAVGGVTHVLRGTDTWQVTASDYGTRIGEIRDITLPDGTQVVLASASAIDVRFDGQERLIILRSGEILVTTAPDTVPSYRPFRVQDRHGVVQALGTRFTMRQDSGESHVAVFEGAVEVRPAESSGAAVRIDAGYRAAYSADQVQAPEFVGESTAAWSRGVLVAENMRISDFVAELARYREGLLRCDPTVADLKVTGVFSLRDTDRALHNLALGLPLAVIYRTRYWVTVQAI